MIEKLKTYFERLESLTTEELDDSIERLVRAEKRNVALVIAHIAEMSRRKGHLERGYKSLFDYCVRRLQLSEGSVARRIQVANVSGRFSQILIALVENRISLTVAGLLAPHLHEENVERLLSDCAGMTKREAEEYLVALRPKPVFAPSIRKAPSPASSPTQQRTPLREGPLVQEERPTPRVSPSILEPAKPDVFNFRFARRPKVQRQVRASGGGSRGPESTPTHGRDHGPGYGHRARQERPEAKACTASTAEIERRRQTLPGRGSCPISLHSFTRSRIGPREGRIPL